MWCWTKKIKVGLAASAVFCVIALPVSDRQITVFPPQVITADAVKFKVKPQYEKRFSPAQPTVYCWVTGC